MASVRTSSKSLSVFIKEEGRSIATCMIELLVLLSPIYVRAFSDSTTLFMYAR
jgi:hypothetical protein